LNFSLFFHYPASISLYIGTPSENIVQKAKAKIDRDPELSAALDSINEREAECSAALEKAFRNRIAIPLPGTCSGR